MATNGSKAAQLRQLLTDPGAACLAGAHNGLGAKLAEETGFDGTWVSSFEVSAARCMPDMSLLSMADYLEAAVQVNESSPLPVLADCDTGYGGRLNVAYTVRQYEANGIAGICIEDKVFPKRNSYITNGQILEDVTEFATRIEIAKRSQVSEDFVLVARTEAMIVGLGVGEALRRAHAYADAGADAVLVHSKASSPVEIIEFLHEWDQRIPVVVVPTTYGDWNIRDAAAAGVSMVIYANHAIRAATRATIKVLQQIRDAGEISPVENEIASMSDIFRLTGVDEWMVLEK